MIAYQRISATVLSNSGSESETESTTTKMINILIIVLIILLIVSLMIAFISYIKTHDKNQKTSDVETKSSDQT